MGYYFDLPQHFGIKRGPLPLTINITNTCENCFRPEISDFGSGLHAISLSIL